MKLTDLRPDKGATRKRKRVGRGPAAGQGKTAGRGTKGQGARRGGKKRAYFEGGQLPLVRRLPFKRGFSNPFKVSYQPVNVDQLEEMFEAGTEVTPEALVAAGLLREATQPVVILGRGDLTKKLAVHAHRFSKSAREKIEAAGGSVTELDLGLTGPLVTIKKLPKEQLERLRAKREAS
ncbi:MAG: 50S ribosomal protein L15 [Anaerolineae bacterium]